MVHPKGLPNTLSRMLISCSLMFFVFSDIFRYDITKKSCVFLWHSSDVQLFASPWLSGNYDLVWPGGIPWGCQTSHEPLHFLALPSPSSSAMPAVSTAPHRLLPHPPPPLEAKSWTLFWDKNGHKHPIDYVVPIGSWYFFKFTCI